MENRQDALNNARLLAAVARMEGEQSRESREAVLDAVILSAQFLAPAASTDSRFPSSMPPMATAGNGTDFTMRPAVSVPRTGSGIFLVGVANTGPTPM